MNDGQRFPGERPIGEESTTSYRKPVTRPHSNELALSGARGPPPPCPDRRVALARGRAHPAGPWVSYPMNRLDRSAGRARRGAGRRRGRVAFPSTGQGLVERVARRRIVAEAARADPSSPSFGVGTGAGRADVPAGTPARCTPMSTPTSPSPAAPGAAPGRPRTGRTRCSPDRTSATWSGPTRCRPSRSRRPRWTPCHDILRSAAGLAPAEEGRGPVQRVAAASGAVWKRCRGCWPETARARSGRTVAAAASSPPSARRSARRSNILSGGRRRKGLETCADTSREAFNGGSESMSIHTAHRNMLDGPASAFQDKPIGYFGRCCALRAGNELKHGTVHLRLPHAGLKFWSGEACGHTRRSTSVPTAHVWRTNHPYGGTVGRHGGRDVGQRGRVGRLLDLRQPVWRRGQRPNPRPAAATGPQALAAAPR